MPESIRHISVIELDFHHDSLDGFLKIFENSSVTISAFTTAKNLRLLENVQYPDTIRFYPFSGGSKFFFLRKHHQVLADSDIVFINTIANDFGAYLALDRRLNTVLRVHNVNKQFTPWTHLFRPRSFYFVWKFFSYVLRQVLVKGFWLFRPWINNRIGHFTFPDEGISAYVKNQGYVKSRQILPAIPLKVFRNEDTAFSSLEDVLRVCIIGATDARRRHYEEVIAALKLHFGKAEAFPIHLTLLGNCNNTYGRALLKDLETIAHAGFRFKSYPAQVPEQEFIACIKNTHLIISPITAEASTDIFREVYGKTKTTGSILDFLKFGKTTLVPAHYDPPRELSTFMLKYGNSEELAKLLSELSTGSRLNELNRRSLEYVQKNYAQEVVLKNTLSIFTSIASR